MTWEMFGRWVFAAIIKYMNVHVAVRRFTACMLAKARTYMYMYAGRFWTAPDTIAYAKVSGEDSIAWRTQMHLTPAPMYNVKYSSRNVNILKQSLLLGLC